MSVVVELSFLYLLPAQCVRVRLLVLPPLAGDVRPQHAGADPGIEEAGGVRLNS